MILNIANTQFSEESGISLGLKDVLEEEGKPLTAAFCLSDQVLMPFHIDQ